jgi:transposase
VLKEKFADDHRVQAVESIVARLDASAFYVAYAGCGKQAVPPDLFLRVVLFEMIDARPSPAQWFVDIANDDRLKYLGRFIEPARSTCYEFRDRMSKFIEKTHVNLLELATNEGLLDPTQGVIDGTIVRAAGSRHQLLSETAVKQRTNELEQIVARDESQASVTHSSLPKWAGQTPLGRKRQLERYRKSCDVIDQRLLDNLKRPKDKQLASKHVLVCPSEPEVQPQRQEGQASR